MSHTSFPNQARGAPMLLHFNRGNPFYSVSNPLYYRHHGAGNGVIGGTAGLYRASYLKQKGRGKLGNFFKSAWHDHIRPGAVKALSAIRDEGIRSGSDFARDLISSAGNKTDIKRAGKRRLAEAGHRVIKRLTGAGKKKLKNKKTLKPRFSPVKSVSLLTLKKHQCGAGKKKIKKKKAGNKRKKYPSDILS